MIICTVASPYLRRSVDVDWCIVIVKIVIISGLY